VEAEYDVAVVGCGPVGQTVSILLAQLGHSVVVLERWPSPYPRPRAVHYDDEVARIFQRIGIADELAPITEPATTYEWQNAGGQTLLRLDRSGAGPSGWPAATMFTQPELERLLERTARALPAIRVMRGWEVVGLHDDGSGVLISAREGGHGDGGWTPTGGERELSARYAIGCDGAGSLVRELMGSEIEDLGFAFEWLIADTVPHDPALLSGVNLQVCDPARPTTLVSGGPGRRRWEWMLLPGETREQVEREEFVWNMLARSGVGPSDVELERFAVYAFRARWADDWRSGRTLLAGDAAHQMPPFAGQGMCSGIRDALTLSWHLDLVLRGLAPESTLDSYTSERRAHLQAAIETSVALGGVICISDPEHAAARDEAMLAAARDAAAPAIELPSPRLGPGLRDGDEVAAAGTLFPQAHVVIDGRRCLLDDATGVGFVLLCSGAHPAALLDSEGAGLLQRIGATLVKIDSASDCEGTYRDWFRAHACGAVLVRPDFYVFGTAEHAGESHVRALVRRLQDHLDTQPTREGSHAR
jgi:2-polyprenyl-6-methoxyphenol hydroxylase-like FAD-dependent oxidoreductase